MPVEGLCMGPSVCVLADCFVVPFDQLWRTGLRKFVVVKVNV